MRPSGRKHAIDFVDVPAMFDGLLVSFPDEREDYGEVRWLALGLLREIVIIVAFAERGDSVRIISARKATKNEQTLYFKKIEDEVGPRAKDE